jgi:hypothetical protein
MNKSQLEERVVELEEMVEEMECALVSLETRLSVKRHKDTGIKKLDGRKLQVAEILMKERATISMIAERIGIQNPNVSCLVGYLKKDGCAIGKDSLGRLFLEQPIPSELLP